MAEFINVFLCDGEDRRPLSNWYPHRTLRFVIELKIKEGKLKSDVIEEYDFLFRDSCTIVNIDTTLRELSPTNENLELKLEIKSKGMLTKSAKN